ncbi:MAG: helix-turn-helix domain-containing protein [Planctomycetaceae bacterium]|nr:helix-turn-helix domain-containing protein [Planctomycetaceae bacterium]
MSVRDVATRLNVSPSCVYQLIESGQLRHHRIGVGRGTIRISEEGLNEYLQQCEAGVEERPSRRSPRKPLRHLKV